jgi:hypothetical protein
MAPTAHPERSRRCEQCGRALAPDERSCEGCALARVTTGAGARRWTRAPIVFGVVAATIEMAIVLWLLFGRR